MSGYPGGKIFEFATTIRDKWRKYYCIASSVFLKLICECSLSVSYRNENARSPVNGNCMGFLELIVKYDIFLSLSTLLIMQK
jgi:hypothetical protein